jgi:hypothetical protein
LCQEYILQWNKRRDELEQLGIQLIMVSIGLPEKGRQLVEHLGVDNGEMLLYVDPENGLYDALELNKGIGRTFFDINTPFAFLDRFTKEEGTKELTEVLSKYSKGRFLVIVIPFREHGTGHLTARFILRKPSLSHRNKTKPSSKVQHSFSVGLVPS